MIKKFCDFCGKEVGKKVDQTIERPAHLHVHGKGTIFTANVKAQLIMTRPDICDPYDICQACVNQAIIEALPK